MAFTACDLGFGTGRFAALSLIHLIPKQRLSDDYLFRLIEEIAYSEAIVSAVRVTFTAWDCRIIVWSNFMRVSGPMNSSGGQREPGRQVKSVRLNAWSANVTGWCPEPGNSG